MNFLVETKNEYTIQLINILVPHIFSGFESIYNEAKNIIKRGEENILLKTFQQFIKKIPNWNNDIIENETTRIKYSSKCDFLNDLLKAVIKSNIILLSNSNNNIKLQENYLDVNLKDFIHRCYIESGRQIYNSPYLFYHELKPIEKKRNQRDSIELIKQSIKEAIRKMLPVKHILEKYLGNNLLTGKDEIDKNISNIESENLKNMINFELYDNNITKNEISHLNTSSDETQQLILDIKKNINKLSEKNLSENKLSENKLSENKLCENKLSENKLSEKKSYENKLFDNKLSENKLSENKLSENKLSDKRLFQKKDLDDKLNSESSMIYIEHDEKYEDVFTNETKNSLNKNSDKVYKKNKNTYFSQLNNI